MAIKRSKTSQKATHKLVVYNPAKLPWERIANNIYHIEKTIFGTRAYSREVIETDFKDPHQTIVLICSPSGRIAGFAYAKKLTKSKYFNRSCAELESIGLLPSLRGHNWGGRMLAKLESLLVRKGIKVLEMDAKISNGFAHRVEKRNQKLGRQVLRSYTHNSEWGKQKFLRYSLN